MANNTPLIEMIKSADKQYVVVGDILTYTIKATNIPNDTLGATPIDNVIISDLLDPEIEFIKGSVIVENVPKPDQSILAGVNMGTLLPNESKEISFKAMVIDRGNKRIKNSAVGKFEYAVEGSPIQRGSGESNIVSVEITRPKLKVVKKANQEEVMLGELLTYTVEITNKGNLIAYNVLFRDQLPKEVVLIEGSFKIGIEAVNSVDLSQGVSIQSIEPDQKIIITYEVQVVDTNCSGIIENRASVIFDYRLPNGDSGTLVVESDRGSVTTYLRISNFKQMSLETYLTIPAQKPNAESINTITGNVDIVDCHVITTPKMTNIEGQKLTGYKLIIRGNLELSIHYTALELEQSTHSAHYTQPFSTFIILPPDYDIGSKLEITGEIEDVYYKLLDIRNFFTNTTFLINVKIQGCRKFY